MFLLSFSLLALAVIGSEASVALTIERRDVPDFVRHDRGRLDRRYISQTLDNFDSLYFANITIGSPPQSVRLHCDTGSSDMWCNSAQSRLCQSRFENCEVSGTYDPSLSNTSKFVNDEFKINYMDGTGARGNYVLDTIGIGGQSIPGLQFGVGNRSTSSEGVLGIGYPSNEVQVNNGGALYPNLPQLMVDQGLIESAAYSLWLNDLDASTGQILFGGVNIDKYIGSLQTVPILQVAGQFVELLIGLSGVSINGTDLPWPSRSLPCAVLMDSGTTLTYLPTTLAQALYSEFKAITDPNSASTLAYVPCDLANSNRTIDFRFSSMRISVPLDELVLPSGKNGSPNLKFADGTAACVFGIAVSQGTAVLGDTFLRSAYVVYDLANNQISLAQTNFNSTTDNIREIGVGANSVPDACLVDDPITEADGISRGAARIGAPAPATVGKAVSSAATFLSGLSWSLVVGLGGVLVLVISSAAS